MFTCEVEKVSTNFDSFKNLKGMWSLVVEGILAARARLADAFRPRGLRRGALIVKKWIIMHKVISFFPKPQKDRRRVPPKGVSGA